MRMTYNRMITGILTTFLLLAGSVAARGGEYGLEFRAHTVQPEQRTSLLLDGGRPFRLGDALTLNLDLRLRLEEHNFGYICRVIINDSLNVDIVSNAGWASDQLSVTVGDCSCLSVNDLQAVDGFSFDKWVPLSLTLDARGDRLCFRIGGWETMAEAPLPKLKKVRISFGMSDDGRFASTDCPPMALRNIELSSPGRGRQWRWTLARHGADFVLDGIHGRKALVRNPSWEADRHLEWHEISRLSLTAGSRPQIAVREQDGDLGVYAATADTLYYIALRGERPSMRTGYAGGRPYNSTANCLAYIPETDGLVSYSVTTDRLNRFDFGKRAWSEDSSELKFSYLHHNELVLPGSGELVVFGGYDEYTYHAELFTREPSDSQWTRKDLSSGISPRYLAASAYAGNGRIFVLGGYGSRTGSQRESPQCFSGFYVADLRTGKAEKMWDFDNPENEVFGNALVSDDDGRTLYALSFRNDRNSTTLKLNSFDVATGERKVFPGSIEYGFHDTDSWCTLLRDLSGNRLLAVVLNTSRTGRPDLAVYSMDWEPCLPEDVFQTARRSVLPWVFGSAAALCIIIAAGMAIMKRRHRGLESSRMSSVKKSVPGPAPSEDCAVRDKSADTRQPFRKPETDVLNIIGPFKWTGHNGEDRTARFSATSRNIFLYILIHRVVTGSGVASSVLDEVFWNSDPSEASNRRNVAMSRLRKLLASENVGELNCRNGVWEITLTEGLFCDFLRLEELLPANDAAPLPDRKAFGEILAICRRGLLLSGIDDEWCDRFKSWYMFRISEFLERAYASAEISGDPALSLEIAEVLLVNDPIDENAIVIKCRSLFGTGRKGQAKAAFESFMSEYEKLLGEPSRLDFQKDIKM